MAGRWLGPRPGLVAVGDHGSWLAATHQAFCLCVFVGRAVLPTVSLLKMACACLLSFRIGLRNDRPNGVTSKHLPASRRKRAPPTAVSRRRMATDTDACETPHFFAASVKFRVSQIARKYRTAFQFITHRPRRLVSHPIGIQHELGPIGKRNSEEESLTLWRISRTFRCQRVWPDNRSLQIRAAEKSAEPHGRIVSLGVV
jgi:hypothetical protein